MSKVSVLLAATTFVLAAPSARAQTSHKCGNTLQPHYRWRQKTHLGLPVGQTPTNVTVAEMLQWQPLALTNHDWCAARQDKEVQVYSVVGWVRVIRKGEADKDWHIELTEQVGDPVTHCIVVEIPSPTYGATYATARQRLTHWVPDAQIDAQHGHTVRHPVQLRFNGPAFFDGWHATTGGHGDCNDTPGGDWELHPVTTVAQP
jgi:hypothetical protein